MSEALTTILNKCHALIDSEFTTIGKCASETGERQQSISEWITQRAHSPSGRAAIKLQNWCAVQTERMAMAGSESQAAYRSSYRRISKEFPVGGKD